LGGASQAPEEAKKVEEEDKGLSAHDQNVLATTRHKEAMKAAVEAHKDKSATNNSQIGLCLQMSSQLV
jgi:hypothetical protein